jgi:hypothetical protein
MHPWCCVERKKHNHRWLAGTTIIRRGKPNPHRKLIAEANGEGPDPDRRCLDIFLDFQAGNIRTIFRVARQASILFHSIVRQVHRGTATPIIIANGTDQIDQTNKRDSQLGFHFELRTVKYLRGNNNLKFPKRRPYSRHRNEGFCARSFPCLSSVRVRVEASLFVCYF